MFGGCVKQLAYTFAGIKPPRPNEKGTWLIQPEFVKGLNVIGYSIATNRLVR